VTGQCLSGCWIGGAYYAPGAANGDCQQCNPSQSASSWSSKAAGTGCNDGDACTIGDVCNGSDTCSGGGGGGGGANDCPSNLVGFRGQNGFQISCDCPASMTGAGVVWGTDTYTDDSALCRAAVHAGAITASGGSIQATVKPGLSSYTGSTRNGVSTQAYGAWPGSYTVNAPCPGNLVSYRGQNGLVISCECSSTAASFGSVWGTDLYTDDSTLCRAAVHAGRIPASGGGIRAVITSGYSNYTGSTRNGVTTQAWGSWSGSYYFQ
jgi:hypothetical protein